MENCKFDPAEFAEFVGARGVNVVVAEFEGATMIKMERIPLQTFQALMKDFIEHKVKGGC